MKINVLTNKGRYAFEVSFHESVEKSSLRIEDEFYTQWSSNHQIPSFPHYEIELLNPADWQGKFHIYASKKNGKHYVCWPNHVPSSDAAYSLALTWAAGTVYTKETGVDFIAIFSRYEGNLAHTRACFDREFDIRSYFVG